MKRFLPAILVLGALLSMSCAPVVPTANKPADTPDNPPENQPANPDPTTPEQPPVTPPSDPEPLSDVLDLRIKKGDVYYSYEEPKAVTLDTFITESAHVKMENVSNGIKFIITKPDGYTEGYTYAAVVRNEMINDKLTRTTETVLDTSGSKDNSEMTFIYPLVEENENYYFQVQLNNPVDGTELYEYVKITATAENGIGDITYKNAYFKQWGKLEQNDKKLKLTVSNCVPPVAKNVKCEAELYEGEYWTEEKAPKWLGKITGEKTTKVFEFDNEVEAGKIYHARFWYRFELPDDSGIQNWRTIVISSNLVTAE